MRIVGGDRKGRALEAPVDAAIRPTSDRVREALFNRLAHAGLGPDGTSPLPGARVLDCFCGSGALGLEALSRGAAQAVFLDQDRAALALAKRNVSALDFAAQARLVQADAVAPPPAPFAATLVFMDPPYKESLWPKALKALAAQGWLAARALITVEMDRQDQQQAPPSFTQLDDRTYGRTRLVQFIFEPAPAHVAQPESPMQGP